MENENVRMIEYDEAFGINNFKSEICSTLGTEFWDTLVKGMVLPDVATEGACNCRNMYYFMKKFEEMADAETVKKILYNVRHGLHPDQASWARDEFLEIGDLDEFLRVHYENELANFIRLNREGKDFYGDPITDEVLEFVKENPSMLAPVRKGNKLYCKAFPNNMSEYIKATDNKMKRYHACHCPFAKESIMSENVVSATLCNCSLGHVSNFSEAFLDRKLNGKVVRSVLNGDLTCEYEITIPDDIMKKYVTEKEENIVIQNYYQYYKMFGQSGIVNIHEGPVCWMMPKEGEKGPSLAFGIHLKKETAEKEVQTLIEEIRKGKVPQLWHITPDSTPENIIEILENHGFQNLSVEASGEEPTMLLNKGDFQPYMPISDNIVCHKVKSKEDFRVWIDVVNTALHGWDMIDAEHYYNWVNNERMSIYLGEIDGLPVSTAATIQNGNVASLEFVSTLENYRRRKVASIVCSKALEDLFEAGVQSVSLGACGDSAYLYRSLGFHSCFNNIIGIYDMAK